MVTLPVLLQLCIRKGHMALASIFEDGEKTFGMMFLIEPQPENQPGYVVSEVGKMTLFRKPAEEHNVMGLLSHARFSFNLLTKIMLDKKAFILNPFEKIITCYDLVERREYSAEMASSPYSRLKLLADTNAPWQRSNEVYREIYTGAYPLVLQTCIEKFNKPNYGRLFLCFRKAEDNVYSWN